MLDFLTKKISRQASDAAVAPHASQGRTLEVGAYGRPSYGRLFPNRVGIDIRPGPGVDKVASVYDLPFADGEFDVVLCMSVLEHLEEPARAIVQMKRVLKGGGRIIVSVPFLFPIHDAPGDYWRFTKYGLRHLFKDGWRIEELKAEADAQGSLAILLQRAAYQMRFRFDKPVKLFLLAAARLLDRMPRLPRRVFGDIHKRQEEPDAFSSSFFMVATKL
jgi:SAM-dependent methyltransferase